jgi:hypothetical protein
MRRMDCGGWSYYLSCCIAVVCIYRVDIRNVVDEEHLSFTSFFPTYLQQQQEEIYIYIYIKKFDPHEY